MSTVEEKPRLGGTPEAQLDRNIGTDLTSACGMGFVDPFVPEAGHPSDVADERNSPHGSSPPISDWAIRTVRCDVVPFARRRRPAGYGHRLEASSRYCVTRRLLPRVVERDRLRRNDRVLLVAHRRRTGPGRPGSRLDGVAFLLPTFDHRGLRNVNDVFEEDGQSTLPFFGERGPALDAKVPTVAVLERYGGHLDACESHDGGALPDDLRTELPVLCDDP